MQKVSKLQQSEAIKQKTVKFTASSLVFWIDLVLTAETLQQKQHHETFPFRSKRSLREIIKLLNLKEWGKTIQTVGKHSMQETMGTKTDLVTIAQTGLKLSLERHKRKHTAHWGWLVTETRYKIVARAKALLTLIVGSSFKEAGKLPCALIPFAPQKGQHNKSLSLKRSSSYIFCQVIMGFKSNTALHSQAD